MSPIYILHTIICLYMRKRPARAVPCAVTGAVTGAVMCAVMCAAGRLPDLAVGVPAVRRDAIVMHSISQRKIH